MLFLLPIWFILALFAGLRYDNADWQAYHDAYEAIVSGGPPILSDPGFNGLFHLLSVFSDSPVFMFLVVAALAVGLNFSSFKAYSPYFLTAVLFYFVHIYVLREMIQIRGGLATAVCLFSLRYLVQKRYTKFVLVWLLAVSIHFSTLIWGLVALCYWLKPSVKTLTTVLVLSLIVGLVYPFGQIIKSSLGIAGINPRVAEYVAYGDEGFAGTLGIFTNINALKSVFISAVLIFLYYRGHAADSPFFYPLLCAYITGTCWMLLFNDFAIIGGRLSSVLLTVEPVLISYLLLLFSRDSRWALSVLLVCITLAMLILNKGEDKVSPYHFYFS